MYPMPPSVQLSDGTCVEYRRCVRNVLPVELKDGSWVVVIIDPTQVVVRVVSGFADAIEAHAFVHCRDKTVGPEHWFATQGNPGQDPGRTGPVALTWDIIGVAA